MPIEYTQLKDKPWPSHIHCCGADTGCLPFMRGMVQSWWRKLLGKPYCAAICPVTKEIVGWEKPEKKKRPF